MTLFILKGIMYSVTTGLIFAAVITLVMWSWLVIDKRIKRAKAIKYDESNPFRFISASQVEFNSFRKKKLR